MEGSESSKSGEMKMNENKHQFSVRGRKEILRAFLRNHLLSAEDISTGFILIKGYPYKIVFEESHYQEALEMLENLPVETIVSFQTFPNGEAVAVVRKNVSGLNLKKP